MDTKIEWKTVKKRIKDLIPMEVNPRILTEEQEEALTESIKKFDLAEIPAINTDNTIVAGHQRLMILSKLGRSEEEIDVRIPNRRLTKEELNEYNIRSNQNGGEWDLDILRDVFDGDDLKDWGFLDGEIIYSAEEDGDVGMDSVTPVMPTEPIDMEVMVICPNCGKEFYADGRE